MRSAYRINYDDLILENKEGKEGHVSRITFGHYRSHPVAIKKLMCSEGELFFNKGLETVENCLDDFFKKSSQRSSIVLPYFGYVLHGDGKASTTRRYFYLVMECPAGGYTPLRDILSQQSTKESPFSAYRLQLALNVALLLSEAHKNNQVHCGSFRPENLFINNTSGLCKLSDCFELRKVISIVSGNRKIDYRRNENQLITERNLKSQMLYTAPETLDFRKEPMLSADIYTLGIILWEILTGKSLLQEMNESQTRETKCAPSIFDVLPLDNVPSEIKPMLESCLDKDPAKRMDASQVVSILYDFNDKDIREILPADLSQIVVSYLIGFDRPQNPSLFPPPHKVDPVEIQRMHTEITTAGKIAVINQDQNAGRLALSAAWKKFQGDLALPEHYEKIMAFYRTHQAAIKELCDLAQKVSEQTYGF